MFEKLLSKLNAIPADKVAHFAGGVILFALALHFIGARYAMSFVAIMAALKEVYDSQHPDKHTCDFWDWFATTLGGSVAFTCTF